jgi:hypothetical protein
MRYPSEIWSRIALWSMKDPRTLLALSLVNKQVHGVIEDDRLWHAYARQHYPGYFAKFPYATIKQTAGNWKHDAVLPVMNRFKRFRYLDKHQKRQPVWEDVMMFTNDEDDFVPPPYYAMDDGSLDGNLPGLFSVTQDDGVVFLLVKLAPNPGKEWTEPARRSSLQRYSRAVCW